LQAWGQPPRIYLAGLLHAAYTVQASGVALFEFSERDVVRSLIGEEAEEIVAFVARTPLDVLLDDGPAQLSVSQRLFGDAIVVHLAVIAQSCTDSGGPAVWLAAASRAAAAAREYGEVSPTPFDGGAARVFDDEERALLAAYETLCNAESHPPGTEAFIDAVVATERTPWVAEPFIYRGMAALAAGDVASASALGERARALLVAWNVPWDKRLSGVQWLALADFLRSAEPLPAPDRDFLAGRIRDMMRNTTGMDALHAQLESCRALGTLQVTSEPAEDMPLDDVHADDVWTEFQLLPARFSRYVSALRYVDAPLRMTMYPEIAARPWWDPDEIPAAEILERGASDAVAEFGGLDASAFAALPGAQAYRVFPLARRGEIVESAADVCPHTIELLRSCGAFENGCGSAFFALIPAAADTTRRRLRSNVALRCCIGLTPQGDFGLEVDGVRERLRFKRCLVLDGSYTHREWSKDERECGMLVVDVWHPDLSEREKLLLLGWNRMIAYETVRLRGPNLAGL
jgi:hypothetical protein